MVNQCLSSLTVVFRVPTLRFMDKACSRCGKRFHCNSPIPGCWCEKVTLDQTRWKAAKENYQNCVCPTCLNLFAVTEPC